LYGGPHITGHDTNHLVVLVVLVLLALALRLMTARGDARAFRAASHTKLNQPAPLHPALAPSHDTRARAAPRRRRPPRRRRSASSAR